MCQSLHVSVCTCTYVDIARQANGIISNPSKDMLSSISNGTSYILVITDKFPDGEIRGNIELEPRGKCSRYESVIRNLAR